MPDITLLPLSRSRVDTPLLLHLRTYVSPGRSLHEGIVHCLLLASSIWALHLLSDGDWFDVLLLLIDHQSGKRPM